MLKISVLAAALLLSLFSFDARSTPIMPEKIPVDRLIQNAQAFIMENPKDANGVYTLARINYFAFWQKTNELNANIFPNHPPIVVKSNNDGSWAPKSNKPADENALNAYLKSGVENFYKAIEMAPKEGLYPMGLAYLLEAGADSKTKLFPLSGAKADEITLWREESIAQFKKAFDLAIDTDLKAEHLPIGGVNALVSHEAGNKYLKLVETRGLKDSEKQEVESVKKKIAQLETEATKKSQPITPIVFNTEKSGPLNDLLASDKIVSFDLDATGRPQKYSWIKPAASLLAWDPHHTGQIVSGLQLFGNVSFNMLLPNGYRALDLLDDNRDGVLSGHELAGLVLWNDLNSNGISDPGEITPIEQSGIAGISTTYRGHDGISLVNPVGLQMKSGQILPTFDWIAINLVGE
jgi:hypothetical protein